MLSHQRRNIRVINLEGRAKDYKAILHDFFAEIKDYIDRERDKSAESVDERINEQMIIPAEDNKLCFISCAMSRISQLSAMLYPILHRFGVMHPHIQIYAVKLTANNVYKCQYLLLIY